MKTKQIKLSINKYKIYLLKKAYKEKLLPLGQRKKYKIKLLLRKQITAYFGNLRYNMIKKSNPMLLESRLDTLLIRAGFVSSINQSRLFINHGLVLVNNKKIHISSYQVRQGDLIKFIKPKNLLLNTNLFFLPIPKYLDVNPNTTSFVFLSSPLYKDIPIPFTIK